MSTRNSYRRYMGGLSQICLMVDLSFVAELFILSKAVEDLVSRTNRHVNDQYCKRTTEPSSDVRPIPSSLFKGLLVYSYFEKDAFLSIGSWAHGP